MNVRASRLGRTSAYLLLLSVLSGCGTSFFANRESNPVIQDRVEGGLFYATPASVFATRADRRTVLVRTRTQNAGVEDVQMCAEPSPDVAEAIAKTIAAKLAASGDLTKISVGNATVEAAIQQSVATAIAPLVYRTQGLQFLRDGLYGLCQDWINGVYKGQDEAKEPGEAQKPGEARPPFNAKDYDARARVVYDKAVELIKQEIKKGGFGGSAFAFQVQTPAERAAAAERTVTETIAADCVKKAAGDYKAFADCVKKAADDQAAVDKILGDCKEKAASDYKAFADCVKKAAEEKAATEKIAAECKKNSKDETAVADCVKKAVAAKAAAEKIAADCAAKHSSDDKAKEDCVKKATADKAAAEKVAECIRKAGTDAKAAADCKKGEAEKGGAS